MRRGLLVLFLRGFRNPYSERSRGMFSLVPPTFWVSVSISIYPFLGLGDQIKRPELPTPTPNLFSVVTNEPKPVLGSFMDHRTLSRLDANEPPRPPSNLERDKPEIRDEMVRSSATHVRSSDRRTPNSYTLVHPFCLWFSGLLLLYSTR